MPTTRGQHKDLIAAVKAQTAFKTAATNLLSGDCFPCQTVNLRGISNEEPFQDHTGRMVRTSSTVNAGQAEWDATLQVRPNGSPAAAPDWELFISKGVFDSALVYNNSATLLGTRTVLSATLSNVSGLTAGMMVPIETSASTSHYNPRLIDSVTVSAGGASAGGTISWRVPLTAAPGSGAQIKPSRTYRMLNSALDEGFTLQTWTTNTSRRTWGSWVNSFTFNVGNNTPPTLQLDGGARGYAQAGPTSLASAITVATGTTLALTNSDQLNAGFVVQIGSEQLLLKTKNNDGTFTMPTSARGLNGTTATSHVANVGVTIPKPANPTFNGRPIPPQYCCVDIAGKSATSTTVDRLEATDATVAFGDGIVPDEQLFGEEWTVPSLGKGDEGMAPQLQVTSKLDDSQMKRWNEAQAGTQVGAVVRLGRISGRMFAYCTPYSLVRNTEQSEGDGQGSIPMTLTFEARGARSGLDALYLMTA